MISIKRWVILGAALAFLAGSAVSVLADTEKQKSRQAEIKEQTTGEGKTKSAEEAGEETGEAIKETGKAIGKGAKKMGKDIGGFFKGLTKGKEEKKE
ncbi:MAG: hypothetical protein ABFS43_19485 [Thermodesulfobacteriota bacterium]